MNRRDKLSPFIVMDILSEAQRYDDVIHLEIGEPDLDPPPRVLEALERAVKDRRYFYTPALGLRELREKVAEFYHVKYGVDISPDRIAITTGTSGAFLIAYSVVLNAGDKIALADPSYPCYKNFAHLLDVNPLFVSVSKDTNYEIRPEHLEGKKIKAVHVSSPSNPTGTVYSEESLRSLAEFCEREGIYLISDEIYHGLVYDGKEHTALEFSDRAIVINGFSKYFCMPGFRIGWMVLPEELVRPAEIVIQNVFISAPTLSQYSALEAFDYQYLDRVRTIFKERRDLLYSGIKELLPVDASPQGAFYLWADVSKYSDDSYDFSLRLLREAKVAVTPGVDFGQNNTNRYIRLAYTRDKRELEEAVVRIREFISRL